MEQINEKIFSCPHCKKQLFQKNNTQLNPQKPEYEHMIQGSYAFNDGDTVPVDLSEFVEVETKQIDQELIVGKCCFCSGEYYAIEIYIASRPVMVETSFIFTNLNRDKGKQELFKIEDDHLLIRYEDCSFVEEKSLEPLTINHHFVGLFALYENISGDIGVSYHYGEKIWKDASDIIMGIISNQSAFI